MAARVVEAFANARDLFASMTIVAAIAFTAISLQRI
jgi:hypothetical protein